MKKFLVILFLSMGVSGGYAQVFGVKTNLLYDLTTTLNLGVEVGLGRRVSLDVSGNYNPWEFSNHKQLKHWLIQPEVRWWLCDRFNGHFLGLHGLYGEYDAGCIRFPFGALSDLKDFRYQGNFYGAGLAYGYQWILSDSWGIEGEIGVGYARFKYDKYPCGDCGSKLASESKNYFGPTKIAVSLIYFIK